MEGKIMDLEEILVTLHSLVRWLVILFAVLALVRAFRGWLGGREWVTMDDRAGLLFTTVMDTQVLLGIILYFFFSEEARAIFSNFSAAMANPSTAFFGLEHWFGMIVAMGVAHMGRAMARKAPTSTEKHKRVAISFAIAIVIVLVSIPWPFLPYGRPLF
jgi:hypothetical protein